MYLLDTNAMLIFLFSKITNATLKMDAKNILVSDSRLFLSVVSLWEIAIKTKIGKLKLGKSIQEVERECANQGIKVLPIKSSYLDALIQLPMFDDHKDPFDRLVLATCLVEEMTLISTDNKMRKKEYGVKVIC